jgi:hypothetical protein
MLNPTTGREVLRKLLLAGGMYVALQVKEYGSGTGSPLIDGKYVLAHRVSTSVSYFFVFLLF